ncbi:hypothetical protein [uncultured Tenacibaculum sp.]|uniref:hypothetical protein n=1 Tax=uncultured Tenacibaculum sp. TaxID=174713 RepID=UPI0026018D50|nr:hypothetical protein [uncultured Tenacibaculum sp.]
MRRGIFLILLTTVMNVVAQKNIKGKLEELKELKSRALVVAIFEEDKDYTERLAKKISKAKKEKKKEKLQRELSGYVDHINYFNKTIKEVIPEYWKLNSIEDVKYLTGKEIEELRKEKNTDYAILDLREDEVVTTDAFGRFFDLNVNAVTYGFSEKKRRKSVYNNYFINTNYNLPEKYKGQQEEYVEALKREKEGKEKILSKENIVCTLTLIQNHINKAIELNKKISFEDFALEQVQNNCSELKGKKVLFQSAIVHGKILDQLKEFYSLGEIELVSSERIAEALNNNEDVIIGFPIIKRLVKMKGSFGPVGSVTVRPMDNKALMNAKTKEFVGLVKHSGLLAFRDFRKKDFQKLNNQCE